MGRDLRNAAHAIVIETRTAQGLPEKVEHPAVLEAVASLMRRDGNAGPSNKASDATNTILTPPTTRSCQRGGRGAIQSTPAPPG
jgi:hypothetical protein